MKTQENSSRLEVQLELILALSKAAKLNNEELREILLKVLQPVDYLYQKRNNMI